MLKAFDSKKYFKIQREAILKRICSFENKLYLEFGGKIFNDFHASRVLPGFEPDMKLEMLIGLKDKIEIIIVANSNDIILNKARNDIAISYQDEVKRLIDIFKKKGFYVSGVVFSFYKENVILTNFINYLINNNINIYKHYEINGYPNNIDTIFSQNGFEKNDYIKTTKSLVIVTAPGPGSGKMATCLSQLYHDNKKNIKAGYAKYETFPVWNLPLNHPVNLAYEAATLDLNDVNLIDPYHLEAYKTIAINYNRDVETFPLLNTIFQKIYGYSVYKSPTDMGVNKIGFAIKNEKIAIEASKDEIIRRYYQVLKKNFLGKCSDNLIEKAKQILQKANLSISKIKYINVCLQKSKELKKTCIALQTKNKIIIGKDGKLLSASAALLINVLKYFAQIDKKNIIISPKIVQLINYLKINILKEKTNQSKISIKEILIILAIKANHDNLAKLMLKQIPKIKSLNAHASVILPSADLETFYKLGINITEEPKSCTNELFK